MDDFFSELVKTAQEELPVFACLNAFYLFARIAPKKFSNFSNLETALFIVQALLFILFMGLFAIELGSNIFKYDLISAKIVNDLTVVIAYISTLISYCYHLKLDFVDKKFRQE